MEIFKAREPVDYTLFASDNLNPATKFNLPLDIRFCTKCTLSNQRPNSANEFANTKDTKKKTTVIADDGRCHACQYLEIKNRIDWDAREQELIELCDRYRRDDGHYDCLVPGSGGKDSVFIAHQLKQKYDMHPLTMTFAPHLYTDWGRKNLESWINTGFDNYLFTPNGRVHRLLSRLALEVLFHPFQPFMIGQKSFAPKLAAQLDIPLIFYGENPAEYGNALEDNYQQVAPIELYTASDPSEVYLGGVSVPNLKTYFGFTNNELHPYIPSHPNYLKDKEIHFTYFSYFKKWEVQSHFYYAAEIAGFQPSPERTPGTYTKSVSIDDKMDDLHYYTTFIKFGIGRTTYESCQDIRCDDLSREEATKLIKRYDGEYSDRFADELFQYLSIPEEEFPVASKMFEQPVMDREYFMHLCDRFRSPHIWKREGQEWHLRKTVWMEEK